MATDSESERQVMLFLLFVALFILFDKSLYKGITVDAVLSLFEKALKLTLVLT